LAHLEGDGVSESIVPILIHLDTPETETVVARENVIVTGWALHPKQPVVSVLVGVDRELWVVATTGGRRADVASEHPGLEITVVALCADGTAAWEMPSRVRLAPTRPR
jgi:hypothetical protein